MMPGHPENTSQVIYTKKRYVVFFQIPQLVHPKPDHLRHLNLCTKKKHQPAVHKSFFFAAIHQRMRLFFKLGFPGHWDRFLSIGIQVHDLLGQAKFATFFPTWDSRRLF